MGDSQLTADVAGSNSLVGKVHNPLSDNIWQGSAVDKEATKLINSTMT